MGIDARQIAKIFIESGTFLVRNEKEKEFSLYFSFLYLAYLLQEKCVLS